MVIRTRSQSSSRSFAGSRDGKPRSALKWLQRSAAAPKFRAMLRGELAISHETLDEHAAREATAYLRSWLVTHGILEVREERLARFERWAQTTFMRLASIPTMRI